MKNKAILAAVMIWGALSFIILIADENPNEPMSIGMFLGIKALALASLSGAVAVGKRLFGKGLVNIKDEDELW